MDSLIETVSGVILTLQGVYETNPDPRIWMAIQALSKAKEEAEESE